jgi:hypothetical protein
MIRLSRKPSLWTDFLQRLAFAVVWDGVFFIVSYWAWKHRFGMPTFVLVILGFFCLIAIVVAWDIVFRFWRTLHAYEPVVEVGHETAAYGDSVQVRIIEAHPESVAEIGMKLVGECQQRAVREFTAHRETEVSLTRCYEDEFLRLKPSSDDRIDRTVQMHIPQSPPADEVAWKIVVDSHLKTGGVIEHAFPIRVSAPLDTRRGE